LQRHLKGRNFRRGLLLALLVFVGVEVAMWAFFYLNVSAAKDSLSALKSELDLSTLGDSETEIIDIRRSLQSSENKLDFAEKHVKRDPLLFLARIVPGVKTQANALHKLVIAGNESRDVAWNASDVLLAYSRQGNDPDRNAIQEGIEFIEAQSATMAEVRTGLDRIKDLRADVDGKLYGPLQTAAGDLDFAIERLDGLVTGYERAEALLPAVLGFDGSRRYLVLPQNDTELFPSGGLISNYGIAVFNEGRIEDMQFEYFVNLYDRWQRLSGGEYIEPPAPLKGHLLRHVSWALGEAGWWPDFPTTAELSTEFVYKGGAEPVDGTIALDLQFVEALLQMLGPITVKEYGITVTAETLSELTLEQTRDERTVPGAPGKSFLSFLAKDLIERLFATSNQEWVELVKLLDRMARERHLQLHFVDPALQSIVEDYGFDGRLLMTEGDFIHLTDTSLQSTKLNLILDNKMAVNVALDAQGTARHELKWNVHNPFPKWQQGRDPRLVRALMLQGVYGSYLRLYAPKQAVLTRLNIDGADVGAGEIGTEYERAVWGRFFTVLPDKSAEIGFQYRVPNVVEVHEDDLRVYRLYIQKQPGTRAFPLTVNIALPANVEVVSMTIDGKERNFGPVETDLREDREIVVTYHLYD
jgi:hypothetical protein